METMFDVWSRTKAPLRRYLLDRLQDDDLAEIFQEEVLLQSYRYLKNEPDSRHREAFLYRLANVMLYNYKNEQDLAA